MITLIRTFAIKYFCMINYIVSYLPERWHRLQSVIQLLRGTRGVTLPRRYPILDESACQDDPGRQQQRYEHPLRKEARTSYFCSLFLRLSRRIILLARGMVDTRTSNTHDPLSISKDFSKSPRSFHRLQEQFTVPLQRAKNFFELEN
jgi:hypothetical protein